MIKVLTSAQLRDADQETIANEPIASIDLMERASLACTDFLLESIPAGINFFIFCGKGNNGGDGLCIARQLYKKGKQVKVFIIEDAGKPTADFQINVERFQQLDPENCFTLKDIGEFPNVPLNVVMIDSIFGSGLNREAEGFVMQIIRKLNALPNKIIAIDAPSGLFADQATPDLTKVIHASTTLCFQSPRQSFLYPEYTQAIGEWQVLNIGLNAAYIQKAPSKHYILEAEDVSSLLKPRPLFGHKGLFGHALLLAGSYGMNGAAILAARACLRSGAGKVTVRAPKCAVIPLQTCIPEAMVWADEEEKHLSTPFKPAKYNAIGIGPGIGTEKETANVLKRTIQDFDIPMVIDADALNILAENPTWLAFLPAGCILTPHPGELKKLIGEFKDPFERSKAQLAFAKKNNCYLLCKGKFTSIACPDGSLLFNSTGNSGMSTAGAGDVLTGMITSFLAQGYSPFQSTLLGIYLHGLAGDLCAQELSENAMIAGDIIEFIPSAFKYFT